MRMVNIALSGNGPLSGKTTTAQDLKTWMGYTYVSHSKTLMELYIREMRPSLTIEEILSDKENYRCALQGYAERINFDDSTFILQTLSGWDGVTPVVFDSIRTNEQALFIASLGFYNVRLDIDEDERLRRSKSPALLAMNLKHRFEQPLPEELVDLVVTDFGPFYAPWGIVRDLQDKGIPKGLTEYVRSVILAMNVV